MPGLALAALGAVVMSACDADRENFISPIGDVILDFGIAAAPSGIPAGAMTIDGFALGGVDLSLGVDAFDRAGDFFTPAASFFTCGGDCPAFEYVGHGVTDDPRTPVMTDPDVVGRVAITPQAVFGVPLFVGQFANLAPATQHFVALERLGTQVNGVADVAAILLSDPAEFGALALDPAADPDDDLVSLGGAGGVTLGSNPFVTGSFTTDASGAAGLPNFVINNGGTGDDYQDTNIADGMGLGASQYNFLVIYEGDPLAGGVPVFRAQIGQEVTPANEPINTSFGEFPTEATDVASLTAASCCALTASSVTITVINVAAINGVYQVWLVNPVTGDLVAAVGDFEATVPGEMGPVIVDSGTGVSSFEGGEDRTVTYTVTDATLGAPVGAFTHIFVSLEGAAATTPSASQPLWVEFIGINPDDPTNAFEFNLNLADNLVFGTFDSGETPVAFTVAGFGQGAFTGTEFGTADLFRARFRNLTLPPVGYYYEGFIRRIEDGDVVADVSTGDLTTEFAEGFASLRDVDVDRSISTQISPTLIIESANRATLAEVGSPFETFDDYVLRLVPKIAQSATDGAIALQGTLPETLKAREQ